MNTAEYIIKRLEELGVNEFFGLPGDYNFNILYAIEENQNTKWIGCTNELNAGYAADGYARIRGYGALVTTYGVGELSAINAIAGSMAENVPVIHIVGLPSTKRIENKELIHHNFQDVNYQNFINVYKSVTAATAFLSRDNAKIEIDRILKILVREKKPVYVAIPDDIAQMEISDRVVSYDWISDRDILNELSNKIAEKINNAQRPVIIGDILIKRFDANIEYKEFVTKSGIPVSNFMMGTNLIDMDSENYLGTYCGKYRNPIAKKYIDETDCLISVGLIYSDLNSFGTDLPCKINEHIAIYGNYTYFEGKRYNNVKMSELLEAITEKIETKDIELDKQNLGLKPQSIDDEQLTSSYVYPRIQDFIKENDILVAETGCSPFGIAQMKFLPSVDVQSQMLWGSIGWATPAAMGMALAKPQSRVVLITGEGAHQLTAMEVGSMLRYCIKPIIIVINNKGYTIERLLCKDSQDKFNDIVQVNYAKFARSFEGDVWATKAETKDDFDKALKVTQIMNKLCYIEVVLDNLDTPALTKEYVSDIKNKVEHAEIPQTNINKLDNIEDVVLTSTGKGFEYETVVHKAIEDDIIEGNEELE